MQKILVPPITPFNKENKVDADKLKTHIKNLIDKGVDLIFLNGSNGLGPSLSAEEKKRNLEKAYEVTDKIIFQVGSLNLEEVISLVKFSADFDIVGVASYPPFYYPRIPEKWVTKYYSSIIEISPHPVYVYNYPLATNFDVTPRIIASLGEKIEGLKDTTTDISHSLEYKRLIPRLKVYTGSDLLVLSSFSYGLDGVVSASGNFVPELLVLIRKLIGEGKIAEAREAQMLIYSLVDIARKYGQLSANYVLTEIFQGYSVGYPRKPIFELSNEEEKALKEEAKAFHLNFKALLERHGMKNE